MIAGLVLGTLRYSLAHRGPALPVPLVRLVPHVPSVQPVGLAPADPLSILAPPEPSPDSASRSLVVLAACALLALPACGSVLGPAVPVRPDLVGPAFRSAVVVIIVICIVIPLLHVLFDLFLMLLMLIF